MSGKPRGFSYSRKGYAEQVHGFITALDLKNVRLVGHGIGCEVAMEVASRYRREVKGLTLIAPTGGSDPAAKQITIKRILKKPFIGEFLLSIKTTGMCRKALAAWFYDAAHIPDNEYMRRYMSAAQSRGYNRVFLKVLRTFGMSRPPAHKVRGPVLIVHGSRDKEVSSIAVESLHVRIHRSQLVEIPGAPHSVMETHSSLVNRALVGFFGRSAIIPEKAQ